MRMQLCLLDGSDRVLVNEWPVIRRCVAAEGEHGFETLELSAELSIYAAARLYAYRGHIRAMVLYGGLDVVWDGRVESKAINGRNLDMAAVGYWGDGGSALHRPVEHDGCIGLGAGDKSTNQHRYRYVSIGQQ